MYCNHLYYFTFPIVNTDTKFVKNIYCQNVLDNTGKYAKCEPRDDRSNTESDWYYDGGKRGEGGDI